MTVLYNILLGIGITISLLFAIIILITGKGDAMSGGSGVRTTFKGKAGFEDIMSRITLILGIGFLAISLLLDTLTAHLPSKT